MDVARGAMPPPVVFFAGKDERMDPRPPHGTLGCRHPMMAAATTGRPQLSLSSVAGSSCAGLHMFLIVIAVDCSLPSYRLGSHPGLGVSCGRVGFDNLSENFARHLLVLTIVAFLNVAHLAGSVVVVTKSIWLCQVKT